MLCTLNLLSLIIIILQIIKYNQIFSWVMMSTNYVYITIKVAFITEFSICCPRFNRTGFV